MSGKRVKLIKKVVKEETNQLFSQLTASIIVMPFKKRLALAWTIILGVRENKRKESK